MRTIATILFIGVLLSGCQPRRSSEEEFLVFHGVIRQGDRVSVTHAMPGVYPSETLAYANAKLGSKIREVTGDFSSECFIVPTVSGYDVVILAKRNLTSSQSTEIRTYVDEALQAARKQTEILQKKE